MKQVWVVMCVALVWQASWIQASEDRVKSSGKLRIAVGDFLYTGASNLQEGKDYSRKVETHNLSGHGGVLQPIAEVLFGNPSSSGATRKSEQGEELSKRSRTLREAVATYLLRTGQCTIVERSRLDEIKREIKVIESELAGYFDQSKLKEIRLKGADYLVYGSVTSFKAQAYNTKKLMRAKNRMDYEMTVELRVVKLSTGEALTATPVKVRSSSIKETSNLSFVAGAQRESGGGIGALRSEGARQIAVETLTSLRPMVVIAADPASHTFIVNYGDTVVEPSVRYGVYRVGEALKDPYTGEELGGSEWLVGTAMPTDLTARTSTLKLEVPERKRGWGKKKEPREEVAIRPGMIVRPYVPSEDSKD